MKVYTLQNSLHFIVHFWMERQKSLELQFAELSDNYLNESPRGKINNVVSEQVRHKPGYTVTEKS